MYLRTFVSLHVLRTVMCADLAISDGNDDERLPLLGEPRTGGYVRDTKSTTNSRRAAALAADREVKAQANQDDAAVVSECMELKEAIIRRVHAYAAQADWSKACVTRT